MENYMFVCIGTNKLVQDSFGPRVGDILLSNFNNYSNINVIGTMRNPVHFQNAPIFLDYLKCNKSKVILIDSALGKKDDIGNMYMNLGGTEIGKAFGRKLYFPANFNIKAVVGEKEYENVDISNSNINKLVKKLNLEDHNNLVARINRIAQNVAQQITSIVYETKLIV